MNIRPITDADSLDALGESSWHEEAVGSPTLGIALSTLEPADLVFLAQLPGKEDATAPDPASGKLKYVKGDPTLLDLEKDIQVSVLAASSDFSKDLLVIYSTDSQKMGAFEAESTDQNTLCHADEMHPVPVDCGLECHTDLIEPKSLEGSEPRDESKEGVVRIASNVDVASNEALASADLPLNVVKVGVEQLGTPVKSPIGSSALIMAEINM
ncbi:hypothetical protein Nepgr_031812 [Nepenthes gracilis]|uniref:Uncharacterized protein n=1 Tax=Nepenthes gracilis TaxID=150966 RepID=A0AAD3Y7E5_NEPGR|nr:hypothetical protein Nepgr_031812 [Nepenthes gracilis]